MGINVFTIGFTKTSAENFFRRLKQSNVRNIVDVRLNNTSQLSGFAKAADLSYFVKEIFGAGYSHAPLLAPTKKILDKLKKEKGKWSDYERDFIGLMEQRKIEQKLSPEMFDGACLLCSEDTPHHCHRRLVVEYLNEKWGGCLDVNHL